jgi:small-conductance mechanosensitive channel
MLSFQKRIKAFEKQRLADSLKSVELTNQLNALKTNNHLKKEELLGQLQQLSNRNQVQASVEKARIDSLRRHIKGQPVTGILNDTLFSIYTKIGASTPHDRAVSISKKIRDLYNDDFLKPDSITTVKSENSIDIVYGKTIIMSVSGMDALFNNLPVQTLANHYTALIRNSLNTARKENSLSKLLIRLGLVILILGTLWLLIRLSGWLHLKVIRFVRERREKYLKSLSYKDYTFLSSDQEFNIILFVIKVLRWFVIALLLYIAFPLMFSIFPFTRGWADKLFQLMWSPFKQIFIAVWDYLPNLFSIVVIYFVMRYFIRFVKYVFSEIESEKLKINGFHTDWAMPTYGIVRFLLYAFMFILIFPYLPGSNSDIFKGVSVFIGILFSLGSSSAIANMIAGLVITYMRPFKIGDRIKIGEISGDVVEKTMLVTRVKTIKNEEITIPNSSVLTGNTTNYTSYARNEGLIIHTTVTIGYDVPWEKMHRALMDAALQTDMILPEPQPFVLQTSLDDFYVSYQLNAYTKHASSQALIYSGLHQHIQDICHERGIEIMSPHYRAQRDGNRSTLPEEHLPNDYQAPDFNVRVKKDTPES